MVELGLVIVALGALGAFLSLAYAADRNPPLRVLVYAVLLLASAANLFLWSAYTLLWLLDAAGSSNLPAELDETPLIAGVMRIAPLLLTLTIVAVVLMLKPFRRLIARLIPIDPERMVHLVAIEYAVLLAATSAVIAVFITAVGSDPEALQELSEMAGSNPIASAWAQALGLVLLSVLGVGLLVQRSGREVLDRLGLTPSVNVRWWLAVPALGLLSATVVDRFWQAVDPSGLEDVSRISEALFEPFIAAGLVGALTVGLSAGIGEELVFRGAAQERFGLALTSFLFAILHTQYTVSPALLQVFVLALLLGLARMRSNTTTAILAHATYNTTLVLLAIYAPDLSP